MNIIFGFKSKHSRTMPDAFLLYFEGISYKIVYQTTLSLIPIRGMLMIYWFC